MVEATRKPAGNFACRAGEWWHSVRVYLNTLCSEISW